LHCANEFSEFSAKVILIKCLDKLKQKLKMPTSLKYIPNKTAIFARFLKTNDFKFTKLQNYILNINFVIL